MNEPSIQPSRCPRCGAATPATTKICPQCAFAAVLDNPAIGTTPENFSLFDIPTPGAKVRYIGDYELIEVIAQGGMGVVYKARQKSLNRIVALKLLLGGYHLRGDFKKRFRQEAELAARLNHPHIVTIYETGEFEGQPYFAMEYVAGPNLAELSRQTPLTPRQAAAYVRTAAEAIAYAHRCGVLHRDLKPSNLMVGPGAQLLITDFGLARQLDSDANLTLSGETIGTPGYLPPEQVTTKRGQVSVTSDVYALGAVLYCLLTGRPPFLAGTLADTLRLVLETDPVALRRLNPLIPRDLETITLKCLAKPPEHRYRNATALAEDLDNWLAGRPIAARPVSGPEQAIKWVRRRPVIAALLGIIFAGGMAAGAAILWQWRQAVAARNTAEQAGQISQNALLRLKLEVAESAAAAGKPEVQLSYLAAVLQAQPTNQFATERLLSIFSHRNFLLPACPPMLHLAEVVTVEFSPDGQRLATGAADGQVMIFDARTGRIVAGPLIHHGIINSIRFSSNGRQLLTCSGENVARIWFPQTQAAAEGPRAELGNHAHPIVSAEFSLDSQHALTASLDGNVQIWELGETPRLQHRFQAGAGLATAYFSPDGRHVVTTTVDGHTQFWNPTTGTLERTFTESTPLPSCPFTPDGKSLALASTTAVSLFSLAQPDAAPVIIRQRGAVSRLAFSPDGNQLATATRADPQTHAAAWIWQRNPDGWRLQAGPLPHDDEVTALEFSPGGMTMLTTARDRTLRLWDASSGALLASAASHSDAITTGKFSPDGGTIATASHDCYAAIWRVRIDHPASLLLRTAAAVSSLELHPDGHSLMTVTTDGTLTLWDLGNGRPHPSVWGHPTSVNHARLCQNERYVVTVAKDNRARIWELATEKLLVTTTPFPAPPNLISISASGQRIGLICAPTNVLITRLDQNLGEPVTLPHPAGVEYFVLNNAGDQVVTKGADGIGKLWQIKQSNAPIAQLTLPNRDTTLSADRLFNLAHTMTPETLASGSPQAGSTQPARTFSIPDWMWTANPAQAWSGVPLTNLVTNPKMAAYFEQSLNRRQSAALVSATFSPDDKLLVTTHSDGRAQIWDARSGRTHNRSLDHAGWVNQAEFSSDSRLLVTASFDRTARVWSTSSGTEVCQSLRHESPVLQAHFNRTATRLLTLGLNQSLRIWDVATGLPLTDPLPHPSPISAAMFSPDGQRVFTACGDLYVRAWELPLTKGPVPRPVLTLAEALAGTGNKVGGTEFRTLSQLFDITAQRVRAPGTNWYGRFIQWALVDAKTNSITFSRPLGRAAYRDWLAENNDVLSLAQAVNMFPGDPSLVTKLAEAMARAGNLEAGAALKRFAKKIPHPDPP